MDRPVLTTLRSSAGATGGGETVLRSLSLAALGSLHRDVQRPTYDVAALRPGVVHLGVGSFHRAHQAVYFDRLAAQGVSLDWGVVGVGPRSARLRADLTSQDCLYTVLELGAPDPRARVVGSLRDYLSAAEQPAAVAARLRSAQTRLVTVTITAPSYDEGRATRTFELLARALDERRRAAIAPFTVLSCDNLPANGDALRRCVLAAASRRSPGLERWIQEHVAFPNSMADRITPPSSEHDVRLLHRRFGIHDRVPVVTEPFSQWVVEDMFSAARPPLEEVGVQLVADVGPYVDMKMRMLNAAHVALGYLGARTPHASTDSAMGDPALGATVERLLAEEVEPVLEPAPGVDVRDYRASVLARLRNPAIADPLCRLRRRGSVRVRNYVLPSLDRALDQGRPCSLLTAVVAAWVEDLARAAADIAAGTSTHAEVMARLEDPDAAALLGPAATATDDVRPLLAAAPGFERVRHDEAFVASLQAALVMLERSGRAAS
ncbi:MAG TPA: mannitol dehydrogenase family protein [Nocardioides sp.]|uniref:mannitol dehydrogenase family protein n=1 Tax=Nocardioides sp. TaxID=35761 RepID=UPI002EDA61A0